MTFLKIQVSILLPFEQVWCITKFYNVRSTFYSTLYFIHCKLNLRLNNGCILENEVNCCEKIASQPLALCLNIIGCLSF